MLILREGHKAVRHGIVRVREKRKDGKIGCVLVWHSHAFLEFMVIPSLTHLTDERHHLPVEQGQGQVCLAATPEIRKRGRDGRINRSALKEAKEKRDIYDTGKGSWPLQGKGRKLTAQGRGERRVEMP